jgi:hypothetical protein
MAWARKADDHGRGDAGLVTGFCRFSNLTYRLRLPGGTTILRCLPLGDLQAAGDRRGCDGA